MSNAVVIGASSAGLAAARALSRRFSQVTLVERRTGLDRLASFSAPANVRIMDGIEAVFLLPAVDGVGGVAIRPRGATATNAVRYLMASLVVCATGQTAATNLWLEGIGWRQHLDADRRLPPGLLLAGTFHQSGGGIIERETTFMAV